MFLSFVDVAVDVVFSVRCNSCRRCFYCIFNGFHIVFVNRGRGGGGGGRTGYTTPPDSRRKPRDRSGVEPQDGDASADVPEED